YQTGPGYPLYYSAQTTILDGLTGEPILDRSIEQTVGVQSSPLTISFKQRGHDMFIYWMGECDVVDSSKERKIDYDKNAPSVLLSQADICKLRYQTTSFTALHGLTQSMKPPGILIYNSNHHVALERSTTKPSSIDVENFLQQYPDYVSVYKSWQRLDNYMQNQDVADTTPSTLADDNNDEPSLTDDSDENDNADDAEFRSSRKKYKRHVGPHDNGGLQRIISTGTLAPSFEPNSKSTIDLIFATYWIPSDTSTLLAANERTCIEDGMAKEEERLKSTNANFYGMDHDAYEHYIEDLCTNKTRLYETVLKISPDIISQSSSRTGNACCSCEVELKKNAPYILAGLGVSGGLLLLANRNIPAMSVPVLSSAADRVAYALRWSGLEGISMVTAVWCVIGVRAKYGTESTEPDSNQHLKVTQKMLTNATESFLTFTAAKLALATVLEPNNLRLIPALSGLFIIGRYSFDAAINHPSRTFGYTINAVATFTAYGLFLYKLLTGGLHSNILPFPLR
ncbi:unnamed protein product, partial [Rotaria magnacalcarata]